jgi:hypothetical protein
VYFGWRARFARPQYNGDIFPWEDVEREAELLESIANEQGSENSDASQEQDDDQIVDRDETDPYNESSGELGCD